MGEVRKNVEVLQGDRKGVLRYVVDSHIFVKERERHVLQKCLYIYIFLSTIKLIFISTQGERTLILSATAFFLVVVLG